MFWGGNKLIFRLRIMLLSAHIPALSWILSFWSNTEKSLVKRTQWTQHSCSLRCLMSWHGQKRRPNCTCIKKKNKLGKTCWTDVIEKYLLFLSMQTLSTHKLFWSWLNNHKAFMCFQSVNQLEVMRNHETERKKKKPVFHQCNKTYTITSDEWWKDSWLCLVALFLFFCVTHKANSYYVFA